MKTKKDGLAESATSQLDLFDFRVCDHAVAARLLCTRHAPTVKRCVMIESTEKVRKTYPQNWHEYNAAQTVEESKFKELLFDLCKGIEEPPQEMGRPRAPIADLIFACCLKVYSGMSGRRNQTDMREALMRGYLSRPVHFNTISKHLEREELTTYLRELIEWSAMPLRDIESTFAADSSGFCSGVSAEWMKAKYAKRPDAKMITWLKVHLMCGCKTNIITSVEVTGRWESDYKYFAPLVENTARNFQMQEVVADKGYSGITNLKLVVSKGATPYIPFLRHTTPTYRQDKSGLWARMWGFYTYKQDEFKARYHARSNVESTFSMLKRKFGERLRSKTLTAQTNEILCKVLCHNICVLIRSLYELGIEIDFQRG
ncbi:MAG TPA: transposase [Pyrinomonadaceae bacterium]|nr:transposase [Pyrinomonadaceae bacterium]